MDYFSETQIFTPTTILYSQWAGMTGYQSHHQNFTFETSHGSIIFTLAAFCTSSLRIGPILTTQELS